MTGLWSNLTLDFSHVSFPLKHLCFPSALLILSKSLNWMFLLGWVNYMKEQNNFDPVPTVNTSPYLKRTCQQAWLHACDTVFAENFQKEQDISGIRVHLCTNPPAYTAQDAHCEGIPQVGLLTGRHIYGRYANGVRNILPFLWFSCNLNQIPLKPMKTCLLSLPCKTTLVWRPLTLMLAKRSSDVFLNPKLQAANLHDWCLNDKRGIFLKGKCSCPSLPQGIFQFMWQIQYKGLLYGRQKILIRN